MQQSSKSRDAIANDGERRVRNRVWDAARSAAERDPSAPQKGNLFLVQLFDVVVAAGHLKGIGRVCFNVFFLLKVYHLSCVSSAHFKKYTQARLTFGVDGSVVLGERERGKI